MFPHRQRLSHYQMACRIKQELSDKGDDRVISALIKDKVKSNRDRTAILKEKQHLKSLGFTQEEINQFFNQYRLYFRIVKIGAMNHFSGLFTDCLY